jgi:oligopeptidase B
MHRTISSRLFLEGMLPMTRFLYRLLVIVLSAITPCTTFALDPGKPPTAPKKPHETKLHGQSLSDDYFWLKDKKNPETLAYLEAENAYTAAVMKPTEKLQEQLYKEYLGRIKQTDLSVPYRDNGYWYYSKTFEGKQYPAYCRKKGSLEGTEEIILDVNELAKGEKFMSAQVADISDDGTKIIFLSDTTGFREYMLSVKDLTTGKVLEDKFVKASDVTWTADGKTLFYVTEDDAKRSNKLWRHTVGDAKEKDQLVYEEKDELFRLGVGRSRDKKFLFHYSASSTSTEQRYLSAETPAGDWKTILPREDKHEYTAEHRDGLFYIRTNRDGATNFKVMTCPVADATDAKKWKDFVPHDPKSLIQSVSLFKNYAVISEREAGIPQLRVFSFADGKSYRIEFPEPVFTTGQGANPEFDLEKIHISYTSMVTPASVFEFDLKSKERKLLKRQEIPSGYDPEQYAAEWVFATAKDGTKVPISIVYKKGLKKDGTAPVLLYGYGSYGASASVNFSPTRLSLLDRGVVFAQGHIRGGSDMGRQWYEDGKMLKKLNTFTDFIACADFLVEQKYGDRQKLVIQGGSAGGLLVGATVNLRPDLCKAAVLQVPFVDVINTMLDETLPLTVQEFLEWGNPKKSEEFEYMKKYCPYSNLTKAAYPAMLIETSLNDSQVLFHEPAKYTAKLRTLRTDSNPMVFRCKMVGGHGGSSGRYDVLKEVAFTQSFMLHQMGIKE